MSRYATRRQADPSSLSSFSHVSIVGYAASLLPKESLFSAGHQAAPPSRPSGDTLYTEHQELLELPKVYAIRDVDYICSVCIKSYTVVVGDDASILLDFTGNIQACSAVRSTVTLSEQRADGTIIQATNTLVMVMRTSVLI